MLRALILSALFATVAVAGQPIGQGVRNVPLPTTNTYNNVGGFGLGSGSPVLPQNFQQPIAGQLTQPVLSAQQALALVPTDQLQAQLNQRLLTAGATGVMPPVNYATLGLGGAGVGIQQIPVQQGSLGLGAIQQQQLGGFAQQQPVFTGVGTTQNLPYGIGAQQLGVGGFQQIQQQPQWMQQLGVGGGVVQQQPIIQQFPAQQQFGVPVQQFGLGGVGMQQPIGMQNNMQMQQPIF